MRARIGLVMVVLPVILSACAGVSTSPPASMDTRAAIDSTKWAGNYFKYKDTFLISMSGPLRDRQDIKTVTIRIKDRNRNKLEEAALEWLDKGIPSDYLLGHTNVVMTMKSKKAYTLRKKEDKQFFLAQVRDSGFSEGMFFYVFAKNGKVLEIQGLTDYLRIRVGASRGHLPDASLMKQTISGLAVNDMLHWSTGGATGSRAVSNALGMGTPFFLTVDNVLSAFKMSRELYDYATRDKRALGLLEAAATPRDKCLAVLTDPGHEALLKSSEGQRKAFAYCREWSGKGLDAAGRIQAARAMANISVISGFPALVKKKKPSLNREDFSFTLERIEDARKVARTPPEAKRLEELKKFVLVLDKKLPH